MSCRLTNIERACGPVYVGLTSVQAILPADVDTYPRRGILSLYETELILKNGSVLYNIAADPGTLAFNEEQQNAVNGDAYQQTVTFRLRKDRSALAVLAEELRNQPIHLLITDQYGQKRFLPWMRLRRRRADNGPRGGNNAHQYTFSGSSRRPAGFLGNQVVTQDGETIVRAVLQSPDGSYWLLAVGLCGALITVSTTSTDVIGADFRLSDEDDNTYSLSVDNFGVLITTASAGTADVLILESPNGDEYEVSVTDNEVLLTTLQGSDLPQGQTLGG
jgi:hypothetical protein